MRVRLGSGVAIAAVFGNLACAGFFMPADHLRPHAAFDMQCTELQMMELSGDCGKKLGNTYDCTLGVTGCGKQVSYSHIPTTDTWVANLAAVKK